MEQQLSGGNAGGASLVGGTVRRATGPWTQTVHALLRHLESRGFDGVPRVVGIDDLGREMLTYVPGATVGTARPWPAWVHSEAALVQVGDWLRRYHQVVADFVPAPGAVWRIGDHLWQPGDVVGHNDAAPYNAVWQPGPDSRTGELIGFIDWDFAGPCPAIWDLAFVVFSWVPLHARDIVAAEGFTDFAARPRRLRLLLDSYGYAGPVREVLTAVRARIEAHAQDVRTLAADGDPLFSRLIESGVIEGLDRAISELDRDRELWRI
jgi:Phosphotransferase enzyme family